jgi:PKD repeat protein
MAEAASQSDPTYAPPAAVLPGDVNVDPNTPSAPPPAAPQGDEGLVVDGPRIRDGLEAESPGAIVSIIIQLRGEPVSADIFDLRGDYGDQAAWGLEALSDAQSRIASRQAELSAERAVLNETLADAGLSPHFARDYRYLVNAVNLRSIPADTIPMIASSSVVKHIERDRLMHADLAQSVPLINADDVWAMLDTQGRNMTGTGVVIANIDTGVDYTHPDLGGTLSLAADKARFLAGNHTKFIGGWDWVNDDNDPYDDHFHGTHVAGIIGANGTLKGVAPGAKQLALKVLSASGYGSESDILASMEYATDPDRNALTADGAAASSLSLGGWSAYRDSVDVLAADTSTKLGTICVIAAGNSGSGLNTIGSPGISRESITVGSTSKTDTLSGFSSRGPTNYLDIKPDIVAPGSVINSTLFGGTGGYVGAQGTSMATPHVSGAIALVKQAHPNWSVEAVKSALVDTAKDIGLGPFEQGGGRLDALAAVNTSVIAFPHKLPMGRLSRLAPYTNTTVTLTNIGGATLNLTLTAKDVFGFYPNFTRVNNNTDRDFVTVMPNSLSLAAGQSGNVTLIFQPGPSAPAGHYWGALNVTGGALLRVPFVYAVRANVLLVDDDTSDRSRASAVFDNFASFPSGSNNISWSLDRLGIRHDIITSVHYDDNGPDELDLKNYALVIWATGYDYDYSDADHTHHTLSPRDVTSLSRYLDSGGQLWLIGQSITWDLYNGTNTTIPAGDFVSAYLGVGAVAHDRNTPNPMNGTDATFMAGASYATVPNWSLWPNNADFATNLTPNARGFTVLNGSSTGYYGGWYENGSYAVAVNNSTYRSLFWGFEFSWLSVNAAFDDATARALTFFNITRSLALPAVDLSVEIAVDPMELDWLPILATRWGVPFDHLAPKGHTFNATVSVVNLGTTAQTNVVVNVTVRDNATLLQQQVTLVLGYVPPLSRVTDRALLTVQKNGLFTVRAALAVPDANPANDAATSRVLAPNFLDEVGASSGWNLTGDWRLSTLPYWTASHSLRFGLKTAANDSATSPLLDLSYVNETATPGGARLYMRLMGVVSGTDALYVEARNVSSGVWVTVQTISSINSPSAWTYFSNGTALTPLVGDIGNVRFRFVTGGTSSSYLNIDHLLVWTFHEYNRVLGPVATVMNATRNEGMLLDFRGSHSLVNGDGLASNYTYAWAFGDGTFAATIEPDHAYPDEGLYGVTFTVTHVSGEREVARLLLAVSNVAPSVSSFGAGAGPLYEGTSLSFSAVCTDPGTADVVSYNWTFGDATGAFAGASVNHTYVDDGNYSVQISCADDDGAITNQTVVIQVLNMAPAVQSASSDWNPSDEGGLVNFTAACTDNGTMDNVSYSWDFGDGDAAAGANVSHTYVDDGNYTVTMTCFDGGGGTNATTFNQEVVNLAPSINSAVIDPSPSDEGSLVNFTALCSDAGANDTITYLWDFGDGTFASGAFVTHTYTDDATHTVVLLCVDDGGGANSTAIDHDVINVAPTASIVSPAAGAEGATLALAALASDPGVDDQLLYTWDFGDGQTSGPRNDSNASHVWRDNGVYQIRLDVFDGIAVTQVFRQINITNVAPTAAISFSGMQDEGIGIMFDANVSDPGVLDTFTYLWDFGDGVSAITRASSHIYVDEGVYNVSFRVTDKDGASTLTWVLLSISNVDPSLEISPVSPTGTEGVNASFLINSTDRGINDIIMVTINFGDGSPLVPVSSGLAVEVRHAFPNEGTYTVQVVARDDDLGATAVSIYFVVVNAAPEVVAVVTASVLDEGGTTNITATVRDTGALDTFTLSWSTSGGQMSVTGNRASVTFPHEGNYTITVTATDDAGDSSSIGLDVVVHNVAPAITLVLPPSVDEGRPTAFGVTVFDPGEGDTVLVLWTFGDGATGEGVSLQHTYGDVGNFTLTVVASDDEGASTTQSFVIAVNNTAPHITAIAPPPNPREGTPGNWSATVDNPPGEALTYAWAFQGGAVSSALSPSFAFPDEGRYNVTLTVSDGEGGSHSLTITVDVENVAPEVTCAVCPNQTVVGKNIAVRANAVDPGRNDQVTFRLLIEGGETLSSSTGSFNFSFNASGRAQFTIEANDGDGGVTRLNMAIDVAADFDRDGLSDATDPDDDNDGTLDADDPAPLDPLVGGQLNTDGSGSGLLWLLIGVAAAGVALFAVVYSRRRRGST